MINREPMISIMVVGMACPMDNGNEDLPKFESLEEYVENGN